MPIVTSSSNRETVEKYWQSVNARDWTVLAKLLDRDYVWEMPQSGERVRGEESNREMNDNYPAGLPDIETHRITGSQEERVRFNVGRAKALRTYAQAVVTPGLRGMFLPFARPSATSIGLLVRLNLGSRFARIISMGDPVRIDPSPAPGTLRDGPHDDYLGPLQITLPRPSDMKGQRDEPVGSALRAWPHGQFIVSLLQTRQWQIAALRRMPCARW